jgi:hypothetical protein
VRIVIWICRTVAVKFLSCIAAPRLPRVVVTRDDDNPSRVKFKSTRAA